MIFHKHCHTISSKFVLTDEFVEIIVKSQGKFFNKIITLVGSPMIEEQNSLSLYFLMRFSCKIKS